MKIQNLKISYQQQLGKLTKSYELCDLGKGEILSEITTTFTNVELPIRSPMFEGKEVVVRDWYYQGNKIKEFSITLSHTNTDWLDVSQIINVHIWEQRQLYRDLKYYFTYENAAFEISFPRLDDGYKSKKGIIFKKDNGELSLYTRTTSAHQTYIQIIGGQMLGLPADNSKYDYIEESLVLPKKVADTITL